MPGGVGAGAGAGARAAGGEAGAGGARAALVAQDYRDYRCITWHLEPTVRYSITVFIPPNEI